MTTLNPIAAGHTPAVKRASTAVERLIDRVLSPVPDWLRIEVYDGTCVGPDDAATTIRIDSPDFFRRLALGRGSELSVARAYVAGDADVDGDIYGLFKLAERFASFRVDRDVLRDVAKVLGIESPSDLLDLRHRPPVPPEEVRPRGRVHSKRRDAHAISAHYDVSNDFYRLFLGPTMTYSCAVFENPNDSLEDAQSNKYDLVCRKLGLQPGMRLLDIGCGWGGMVLHAAQHYGVDAVGITISREQRALAQQRVADAGLSHKVEIRFQDYRDVADGSFDAVSSIGMFEHVGELRTREYFTQIERLLRPGGRLLNHAINWPTKQRHGQIDPDGFMARYVFPDGELLEVGQIVTAMQSSGLEVRHVESLREHYALTLREWVRRLEDNWTDAVGCSSLARAKVWRLYMAVSAIGFEQGTLSVSQVLATRSDNGSSEMPLRPHW
jgi:cyclopropane-fatty-acyl-phospholipid synthase